MKVSEIREMTPEERDAKLLFLQEEYFNLRFRHGIGELENTALIPKIKHDIARVKTIIKEVKLAESQSK
jgi:large subunit ribosomal protein L29